MTTGSPTDFKDYRPAPPPGHPRRPRPPAKRTGRRRRRRSAQPPRKSRLGRVLLWMLAFVVIVAGSLAGAVYYFTPAELVRNQLVQQIKAQTGRELTIAGTPSLTFYPSVGVSLPRVSLSPPPGMAGGPMMRADRIVVSVAVAPLLTQKIVVNEVQLRRPIIDLRVDRSGRRSWDFAALRAKYGQRTRLAQIPSSLGAVATDANDATVIAPAALLAAQPSSGAVGDLEIRSVRITQGLVQYLDETTGDGQLVSDVNVVIDGQKLSDPMALKGNLVWREQRLDVSARLTTLRQLLDAKPATANVNIRSAAANATFNGTVTMAEAAQVAGPIQLSSPSIAALMRWLGTELPNGQPLGALSINGELRTAQDTVTLDQAKIALGPATAKGTISTRLGGVRPLIKANLRASQIDIDKISAGFQGARTLPRAKLKPLSPGSGSASAPKSIEEILRGTASTKDGAGRFSPQVKGYRQQSGWSSDPIDSAALLAVDADARLLIDGLKVGGLAIQQISLRTTLNSGSARADIDDIALYDGRGRGVFTARAGTGVIKVGLNVSLNQVAALPLLKDAADVSMIDGRGRLTAALGGGGRSQQEIMSSLSGRASFVFTDGALIGWNIPQMLRGLQSGQVGDLQKTATAKTDFTEFSANFSVSRGVANTQDMRMVSPFVRLNGSGNTDLGRRYLDMILRPKLVASVVGQGGQQDLAGIEVPVRITGSWDDPKATPDLSGVLSNPGQVVETVKEIGKKFKGKNAGEIVRQLLGNRKNEGGEGESGGAGSILKNLFKN